MDSLRISILSGRTNSFLSMIPASMRRGLWFILNLLNRDVNSRCGCALSKSEDTPEHNSSRLNNGCNRKDEPSMIEEPFLDAGTGNPEDDSQSMSDESESEEDEGEDESMFDESQSDSEDEGEDEEEDKEEDKEEDEFISDYYDCLDAHIEKAKKQSGFLDDDPNWGRCMHLCSIHYVLERCPVAGNFIERLYLGDQWFQKDPYLGENPPSFGYNDSSYDSSLYYDSRFDNYSSLYYDSRFDAYFRSDYDSSVNDSDLNIPKPKVYNHTEFMKYIFELYGDNFIEDKIISTDDVVVFDTEKFKHLWILCEECYTMNYKAIAKLNMNICEFCQAHMKMKSSDRIELLIDAGTWNPMYEDMVSIDPIKFDSEEDFDKVEDATPWDPDLDGIEFDFEEEDNFGLEEEDETYLDRLASYQEETGLTEAVQTGIGNIGGVRVAMAVMDFEFIGGSMGSVVGEKITRLIDYAINHGLPLIIVAASGGARMQEGSLSLMQMAKISSALYRYQVIHKLLYVSILTSPTTGGVTASFGMLGDVILVEPNAYIAFAGKRVIEETLKQEVPEGSQSAEVLFEKGTFDLIIPRPVLKGFLHELFMFHGYSYGRFDI